MGAFSKSKVLAQLGTENPACLRAVAGNDLLHRVNIGLYLGALLASVFRLRLIVRLRDTQAREADHPKQMGARPLRQKHLCAAPSLLTSIKMQRAMRAEANRIGRDQAFQSPIQAPTRRLALGKKPLDQARREARRRVNIGGHYLDHQSENVFYRSATFYSARDVEILLVDAGFGELRWVQTLFKGPSQAHAIEETRVGYGEGSILR